MSGQITPTEFGLFINGVDTSDVEESFVFEDKPNWLSNKVSSHIGCCNKAIQGSLLVLSGNKVLPLNSNCRPFVRGIIEVFPSV